ncbi:MAG: hypothetical protein WAR37_04525 [Candidatus Microsaccharimonas sp.]
MYSPRDWAFVLLIAQFMGVKWLMVATDFRYHDIITPALTKKRRLKLFAGMATIWLPYLIPWMTVGIGPTDILTGGLMWWWSGLPIGLVVAIVTWYLLLVSPIQAVIAAALIARKLRQEKPRDMRSPEGAW